MSDERVQAIAHVLKSMWGSDSPTEIAIEVLKTADARARREGLVSEGDGLTLTLLQTMVLGGGQLDALPEGLGLWIRDQ